jgi:hypothetical protein
VAPGATFGCDPALAGPRRLWRVAVVTSIRLVSYVSAKNYRNFTKILLDKDHRFMVIVSFSRVWRRRVIYLCGPYRAENLPTPREVFWPHRGLVVT